MQWPCGLQPQANPPYNPASPSPADPDGGGETGADTGRRPQRRQPNAITPATSKYGNTNTTADHTVTYKYKSRDGGVEEPTEWTPEAYAVWILVIAIALFITAVVVTRMLRREEP